MNSFFESDIVINELNEIDELKKQTLKTSINIMTKMNPTEEEAEEYFSMLTALIEKQQIFLNRIYFSDDKEAVKVKEFYEKMLASANAQTGKNLTLNEYFEEAKKGLSELKNSL